MYKKRRHVWRKKKRQKLEYAQKTGFIKENRMKLGRVVEDCLAYDAK